MSKIGFSKKVLETRIFENKGAMSGCVYVTDYDVYHK